MAIRRILILGHTGFIGSNLERRLKKECKFEVIGGSPAQIDLTDPHGAAKLVEFFEPDTAVVMCSAIKRQAGDTIENYAKNVAMAENLSPLLRDRKIGRLIYLSSAAVYGEDIQNTAITERTPAQPTSYYGMAKFTCERLLLKALEGQNPSPLVILRPATVYGPGEPGRPYGPMGFLRAALAGESITLWGDGHEKREFVFIEDVCAVISKLLECEFSGVLNLVSGRSVTFQDILSEVSRLTLPPKTSSRPRTKDKADHGFDNSLLHSIFPGFRFTPLAEGLKSSMDVPLTDSPR